jgi:hypothetical protein
MKKLTVIFISLIVMVNCFSISYIIISTHFANDTIIKDIAWEVLEEDEKKSLSVPWADIEVKLIKIEEEKSLKNNNKEHGFDYDIALLNGGYLVKVPVKLEEKENNDSYSIYINPFTKKVAGTTK